MRLNKSTSYVLLALLRGHTTSTSIHEYLTNLEIRTIQRALSRLLEMGLLTQSGPSNDPVYAVSYPELLRANIPEKLLTDEDRPESIFNYGLLDWLEYKTADEMKELLGDNTIKSSGTMSPRDIEYLTVELSWKSSALEGNTYSLLDTQLLLTEGIKPTNRTEFETQMILNHKDAIAFALENKDLFEGDIVFSTVEELHRIVGRNLGINSGVRSKAVRITASNYIPPETPAKIREAADRILAVIGKQTDPFAKALLALSFIPYLQIFEDGNKRTGRIVANAILIAMINRGFSLRNVDARHLALAYLGFYEFGTARNLRIILEKELARSL